MNKKSGLGRGLGALIEMETVTTSGSSSISEVDITKIQANPDQPRTYFDEEALHMRQLLKTKLVDLDLSVRALNCLKAADVETLAELVSFNRNDLLKFRNFGKKSLVELDAKLLSLNLSFGMDIVKYKLDKE